MDPVDYATIGSLLTGTAMFSYWGGQMKRAVSELVAARLDHESRIRKLEGVT
jgi:hypothetical protein